MASVKTWFVQTGFGTVLGPMPEDALHELVRTGALVQSDQIREGQEGGWRPALDLSGLFETTESVNVSTPAVAEECVAAVNPIEVPAAEPSARVDSEPVATSFGKGRFIPPPAPQRVVPPQLPESTPEPEVAPAAIPAEATQQDTSRDEAASASPSVDAEPPLQLAPPEDDLIVRWKRDRDRSREELGTVSLAEEISTSVDEANFAPELPSDLLDDELNDSSPAQPTSRESMRKRETRRASLLDQVSGLEPGLRVLEETTTQKWDRWRRSLPDLRIAAGILLVVVAAWWFWPRSSRGTYDRYVAIWSEWKVRRDDRKDQAGWDQFLQRTDRELKTIVPYLEKHARVSDREKLMLLFVGRDCLQKMLVAPRAIGSPREKQLQFLLATLDEYYRSPATALKRELVLETRPTAPRKPSPTPDASGTIASPASHDASSSPQRSSPTKSLPEEK